MGRRRAADEQGDVDPAADGEPADRAGAEESRVELQAHGRLGHHAHPQPGGHRLLDGLGGAELHGRSEPPSLRRQPLLEHVPGARPAFPGDERLTQEAIEPGDGLINMRDRMETIGGALTVSSRTGQGTTVRGSVPLAPRYAAIGRPS